MFKKQVFKVILLQSILFVSFFSFFSLAYAQKVVPEKDKYGGMLTIAIPSDFKSLDARYVGQSGTSRRGQQHLYNRMVEYGPKGAHDIVPGLATDWKQIDQLTWLVHLREGVKFHNGKELTAEDLVKNYDWKLRAKENTAEKGWRPPRGRSDVLSLKKVEAVDKYTLKYTLNYPFVPFVSIVLGWGTQAVIDPDIVEKYGNQATLHPVGTGPFKFREYVSGSHLILDRFDDFWGGKTYLDRIVFRIIPDVQTRFIALQKGEVDLATDLLFSQIPELRRDSNLAYHLIMEARKGSWGNLWFNFRRWPMNQLKFRQAVAMGADWKNIAKAVFPKGIDTTRSTFFERSWLEDKDAKKLLPAYAPAKAKQLLKEVEKEARRPIPPLYSMTNKTHQGIPASVLQIGAEQLKKIGLKLDVYVLEDEVSKDKSHRDPKSEWDLMIASFTGPAVDPGETMVDFYSKTPRGGDGKNLSGYSNPKLDELYIKGGTIPNKEQRKKTYQEIERILLKDIVVLPIFDVPFIFGYSKRVHDFPAHDSANPLFRSAWNNVWVEKK